jgi:hypothetical protein
MRYFKLEESIRKKVIGNAYPQIQHFKKGDDGNKTNSCSQLGGYIGERWGPSRWDGDDDAWWEDLTD